MHRENPRFAVLILDINDLKVVNDHYGHDFGDMLIIDCCKRICKAFKHSPVYRIGGDEFIVILESPDYDNYPVLLQDFEEKIDIKSRMKFVKKQTASSPQATIPSRFIITLYW